ncbi:hypothetical protein V8F20_006599 [Naviculisporaceae sp. PSN 640]
MYVAVNDLLQLVCICTVGGSPRQVVVSFPFLLPIFPSFCTVSLLLTIFLLSLSFLKFHISFLAFAVLFFTYRVLIPTLLLLSFQPSTFLDVLDLDRFDSAGPSDLGGANSLLPKPATFRQD